MAVTVPHEPRLSQIKADIAAARGSVERSRRVFSELQSTLGLAKASQLWWAYFGAYDAAET